MKRFIGAFACGAYIHAVADIVANTCGYPIPNLFDNLNVLAGALGAFCFFIGCCFYDERN